MEKEVLRKKAMNPKYNVVGLIHSNPKLVVEESFISGAEYGYSEAMKEIEIARVDAYNSALADAALLGRVEYVMVQSGNHPIYEWRIDHKSIMKLKK